MANCGTMLKTALVAIVLVAVIHSGSAAEKLASCCRTVSKQEITDPITAFMYQRASGSCVQAVIFQTPKGLFCCHYRAPWVVRKVIALRNAKQKATTSYAAPSSTVSLLSIITSTPYLPPSSSLPPFSSSVPSFLSSSETPTEETFSEKTDESTSLFSTTSQ